MSGDSTAAAAFRERRLSSEDGLSLYFRDYGDPLSPLVPVLCLTGLTRNSKDFDGPARRLAERRRVLCPDYRGRGRSDYDRNWRRYEPRTYLGDVRHLLAAANVHRVVVVGTSLGGLLAAAMSVLMPGAVAGAVINDIGPEMETDGLGRIVDYVRDSQPMPDWDSAVAHLKEVMPSAPGYSEEGWRSIAKATYVDGDDGLLHPDWDPDLIRPMIAGLTPVENLWPYFRALGERPVLALRGALSDILSAATLRAMAAALPGCVAVTVDGVGHTPALTEPAAVEAIDALLHLVDAGSNTGSPD